jgi:ABC-type nitrate/sulfonate/bicarbonate transport system substrate-binding protein
MNHISLVLWLIAGAWFSPIAWSAPNGKIDEVKVCYFPYREEMTTAALYTADHKGFFGENNIHVQWQRHLKPGMYYFAKHNNLGPLSKLHGTHVTYTEMEIAKKLKNGKCDIASTTFESILGAGFSSLDSFEPLAVYRYGKDYDTHLAQRSDLHLKNLSELKGKRIRASGIPLLLVLDAILKSANLTLNDVKTEIIDVPNLSADLDGKKADLVIAYVPTIPMLLASNRVSIFEKNVYAKFLNGLSVPHSMLMTSRTFAKQHPEILKRFMIGFKKGTEEISKHPENVVYGADIIDYPQKIYERKDIEKSLNFFSVQEPLFYDTAGKNLAHEAQFAEYQKVLVDRGFIKSPSDLSTW